MTPLQAWSRVLFDLLEAARDQLSDEQYVAFVYIATERIGLEAARLVVGEATRATRADEAA